MNIIGHQKIQNFLNKSIERNSVAQAYIFSGPENLGKFSLALNFAQKLTGNNAEINPDIIVVSPDITEKKGILKEEKINVEKIRELQHHLSTTSYFGKHKIAIIDNADKMNKFAQNAMLKTLEEPMEKIVLILIVRDLNKILPTIISRCTNKKFTLVSDREIEKIIPKNAKDKEEIIFWSLGRPGLAQKMVDDKRELGRRVEINEELTRLFNLNVSDRLAIAEKMSKDTSGIIETLNLWMIFLRQDLLGHKPILLVSKEKLVYLMDKIEESLELVRETNSNARLVMENLLLDF